MNGSGSILWLALYGLFYAAVALYWARVAAQENGNHETYFSAGHSLPPWLSAVILAGASVSGWFLLGGAAEIARHGFIFPAVLQGGIALALPGVLFFKRLWFVGQRFRLSSQPELFRMYFQSDFLVVVSVSIAVLFAVGFAGLQIRALSLMIETLSGQAVSQLTAGWLLGLVLFAYVVIGGMRAVGFLGVVQSVMLCAATSGLAVYALYEFGSFAALNSGLEALALNPAKSALFDVSGVVQFTAGLGRDEALGHIGTSVMNLSMAFALMGFQVSPLAFKIVLSTRSARGFAAGQTWVMAGVFGGLIVFGTAIVGAAGLLRPDFSVTGMLVQLQQTSPWFTAWLLLGAVCGVQMLAGLAFLVAGESLVRNLYKPYFHSALSRRDTVNLTRIVIGLLVLGTVLMTSLTPVTLSALGAVALPLSFQLWTPLLGMTWLRWITRSAAVCGVGFGIGAVLLTEPLGYQILSFLGLELPWGRWPWTIHSAAWGMFFNLAAVLIVSAITNRDAFAEEAQEARRFIRDVLGLRARTRALSSTAWAAALAWIFFAIGPGLVFGNFAFGTAGGEGAGWIVGMPSIWAWAILFWALGVGLVWFLAYRMEMASPLAVEVPTYEPRPRLRPDQGVAERERLRKLIVSGLVAGALVILIAFSFGR